MDSKFATTLFLSDWTVYGYRLKPFCLLHSARLEALGSPLVCGGDVKPHDILIAAQVCSSHAPVTKFARNLWRLLRYNSDAELAKFDAYRSESGSGPDLYESTSTQALSLHAPWQLIVVTSLVRNTSITEQRAWTMPEGMAQWYFYASMEQASGKSPIYSEREQQEDAELLADAEVNRERNELRMSRFIEYQRRREAGTWPNGLIFDHDAELPQEGANNG